MGSKSSCQGKKCKQEATGTCSCSSIFLCVNCYEIHRDENPTISHSFTPLKGVSLPSEDQPITWRSIILTKLIYRSPEGSTEVHEGKIKDRLGKYAIKIMYCRGDGDLLKKQKESEMQISMKHPNICECKAAFLDESYQNGYKFVIVMEFSEDGDIEQEIEKRKLRRTPWTESELFTHISELIDAFAYLQTNNLTHGDIKPRNLYLTSQGKIKVGDFGESQQSMHALVTQTYQVTGTVIYFSPLLFSAYLDIIKGKNVKGGAHHNPIKSDVYSLGLSLLHMASLNKPTELNNLEIGLDNLQSNVEKVISKLNYSENIKMVFTHMLQVQENKRYDFKQLRNYLNPGTPKDFSFSDDSLKINRTTSSQKISDAKLISISQIQGKANILDPNLRICSVNSHRLQSSARAILIKDSAIISGGLKNSKSVFKINILTCAAIKLCDLNEGRSWHTMLIHNEAVFVLGGRSDHKEPLKTTEILNLQTEDLTTSDWAHSACLHKERENATAISIGDCIFLFGGSNKEENRWKLLDSIERFQSGTWEEFYICKLIKPSSGVGLGLNSRGNILIIGGGREKGTHSNEIYEFDHKNGEIFLTDKVINEADSFSSGSFFNQSGKLYIMGNLIGCHVFDEKSETWDLRRYK